MFGKSIFIALAMVLTALLPSTGVQAHQTVRLESDVRLVRMETTPEGNIREELVEPATVVPGDRLVFSNTFRNASPEPVESFTITNPLPAPVMLASDADPSLTVSVDGGRQWGVLRDLTLIAADGEERPAQPGDVTHVRWVFARIPSQEGGSVEFPAIVR